MLKNWKKFDWKGAVESTLGGLEAKLDAAMKGDGSGSPSSSESLQGQLRVYQELLVDAQFSQLVLFREQQALFAEKDREIEQLKLAANGCGTKSSSPTSDSDESGECAGSDAENQGGRCNSDEKHAGPESNAEWTRDWERRMKDNIMEKIEAVAQARERDETVRALSRQLEALKEMLRAQDRKAERSKQLEAVLREAERADKVASLEDNVKESDHTAYDALAFEFAKLSKEYETQRQQLCDVARNKASLEEELERQATHIELLMSASSSSVPNSPESPVEEKSATELESLLAKTTAECQRLEHDLAQERQRCVELSEAKSTIHASGKLPNFGTAEKNAELVECLSAAGAEKDAELASLKEKLTNSAAELASVAQARDEKEELVLKLQTKLDKDAAEHSAQAVSLVEEHTSAVKALGLEHQTAIQALESAHEIAIAKVTEAHNVELIALREQHDASTSQLKLLQVEVEQAKQSAEDLKTELTSAKNAHTKATEVHLSTVATLESERDDSLIAMAEAAAAAAMTLQAEKDAAATALEEEKVAAAQAQEAAVELMQQSMQAQVDENRRLYVKESSLRKRVHNELMDLKGNIRVYCRVRPVLEFEKKNNGAEMAADVTEYPVSNEITLTRDAASSNRFEFDTVFQPSTTQEEVFEDISPLITSVLDGYDVCIFAYGQTGSGKTYTMEGSGSDPGVNFRALQSLFTIRDDRKADETYDFSVSVLEIYNENIRDLLTKLDKASAAKSSLDLRLGSDGKMFVQGLEQVPVTQMSDVKSAMRRAQSNRAVGAHNMNEHSSRSHLVLTVSVTAVNKISGERTSGSLNLIDLAGSERVGKTDATGDRLKEAQAINKSLSALGDVISALGQQKPGTHVPFRNSKLTHLLQNSMSGDSKVAMFVNISPIKWNVNESITSLQFAQRCRKVELGAAKKNGESKELQKYKLMVDDLKAQLGSQSRNYQSTPSKFRK